MPCRTISCQGLRSESRRSSTRGVRAFPDFPQMSSLSTSQLEDTSYYVYRLTYSPSADEASIHTEPVLGLAGEDGCSSRGNASLGVTDKIVLVQRHCYPTGGNLRGGVRLEAAAEVAAVSVYNNVEPKVTGGRLSAPDPAELTPAGIAIQVDSDALSSSRSRRYSCSSFPEISVDRRADNRRASSSRPKPAIRTT